MVRSEAVHLPDRFFREDVPSMVHAPASTTNILLQCLKDALLDYAPTVAFPGWPHVTWLKASSGTWITSTCPYRCSLVMLLAKEKGACFFATAARSRRPARKETTPFSRTRAISRGSASRTGQSHSGQRAQSHTPWIVIILFQCLALHEEVCVGAGPP